MSLESLKGTWVALGSARALMHIPRVVSDRLMLTASLARSPAHTTCSGDSHVRAFAVCSMLYDKSFGKDCDSVVVVFCDAA